MKCLLLYFKASWQNSLIAIKGNFELLIAVFYSSRASDRYILNYGIVSKAIWVPTNCALLYWCDKELSDISYQSVCTPLRNADKNIITYPCLVYTTSLMAARTECSHIVSNSSHYTFMIQPREDEIPISKGMQIGSSINASVWWN